MSNEPARMLGEIIKEALKEKGLNQSAVAKKMNVSKQVINQIDRRKYFDIEFLQKLREVTGLDFTNHSFNINPRQPLTVAEPSGNYRHLSVAKPEQVEMSLAIKIKASPEQINNMGDLLISIKREASRLGFTIM